MEAAQASTKKNEVVGSKAAKVGKTPMTFGRTFDVIKETLHKLSPQDNGGIVYISKGANTMDISRSVIPVEHPRLRLDAGTCGNIGVGQGCSIAAYCAYNLPSPEAQSGPSHHTRKSCVWKGIPRLESHWQKLKQWHATEWTS